MPYSNSKKACNKEKKLKKREKKVVCVTEKEEHFS